MKHFWQEIKVLKEAFGAYVAPLNFVLFDFYFMHSELNCFFICSAKDLFIFGS